MSECTACDHDTNVIVTKTYTMIFDREAISVNKLKSNTRSKWNKYRQERHRWEQLLGPYLHLPKATKKRRVYITRFWGKSKRAYDYGNLVGGFKPLLDMLVKHGFLVDDSPKYLLDYYRQAKAPDNTDHIIIVIEEIE